MIPVAAALLCVAVPVARASRWTVVLAALGVTALAIATFFLPPDWIGARIAWAPQLGSAYRVDVDGLSAILIALVGSIAAVAAAASGRVAHDRAYHALLAMTLAAYIVAIVARDLLLFFLGWEAAIVPLALLVWRWGGPDRRGATWRMVAYALSGDALVLVGIASLAVARGTLDLDALAARRVPAAAQVLPAMLVLTGLAVRLPAFPLHAWLPRLARSAPMPLLAVILGVGSSVAVYAIARFPLYLFPQGMSAAAPVLVALASVGVVYGALLALRQDDVRAAIAYASVAQVGVVTLGIFTATANSLPGAMLAAAAHALAAATVCVLAAALARRTSSYLLSRAGGLAASAPQLSAVFTFALVSAIGLPGTVGFAGTLLTLVGTYERFPATTSVAALGLALLGVFAARGIRRAFHGPPLATGPDLRWRERALLAPLLAASLVLGLAPRLFIDRIPEGALPAVELPQ